MITETALGKLKVKHECLVEGTEIIVPMRPAHVIGQLIAAAILLATKESKS